MAAALSVFLGKSWLAAQIVHTAKSMFRHGRASTSWLGQSSGRVTSELSLALSIAASLLWLKLAASHYIWPKVSENTLASSKKPSSLRWALPRSDQCGAPPQQNVNRLLLH